ncbi:hypothetical protein GCM10010912_21110 [Paenibacillus albidus]|uniref:LPXTG cell wall anchor domain-containing protein n=1 Tax=Paenibacillus albidus TaxID=2041023 RepID=A0A917C952_9BACL|nr:LPXTG cell wall anchor domain-containing protein [Paenibacillus albidus]GGF75738.1 hypothetical protein GCM10010912_21110 [Paenibacillus albidus]
MMKKRISLMLVMLMLVAQYAYGIGFTSEVKAAGIENDRDIITSVSMAVYGPDGQTVTGNVYAQDSNVTLDYTWALPNGHPYKAGATFTFQLPEQFQLYNDIGGSLVSEEGDVGSFSVSQATHQVVMSFNDYIETHDNVQGTLRINTKFNKQVISGSVVQQILFPVNGGIQTVTVTFKPDVGSTIEKSGRAQGFNADSITWTVDVNKKLESVSNAVVTDPLPSGLSLDVPVTVAVYTLDVRLDGSVSQGAQLDSSEYSAEVTDGILSVRFSDPVITGAYRIQFSTAITDESRSSFTNTATFTGEGRTPADSSATVNVERGGSLKKYSTKYDSANQVISWAIEYNYNNKTISGPHAVLTDLFNDTQELVPDSLKVYPVTLDSAGKATKGDALTEGQDYTVTGAAGEKQNGFTLQFKDGISSPYRIEYQTKATDRVFNDSTVYNTVSDSTYSEQASQHIRQVIVYKTLSVVNYQTQTLDWKVTLNGDNYQMNQVLVTDTFPAGGLKFIPSSLTVRNAEGAVLNPSEYTLDYETPVEPSKGFKIKFKAAVSGTHTITYQTLFNNDWLTGNTDNFINHARIDWKDDSAESYSAEAKGLFIPRIEVKNNGFKSGSYNASSKEITWTVGANYNGKTINKPLIADVLKSGQSLVPGSVKVYEMNIAKNGDPARGAELNSNLYTYSVGSDNKLVVEFTKTISAPYYLVFTTSLEGRLIGSTLENTANVWDGANKVSKDLKATIKIPFGAEYVNKNGVQNGEKIDWSLNINRSQSHVRDAVITDTPSPNQILLPDTFHLYPTTVAANGDVVKSGPELVKGTDYLLAIQSDEDGKESFKLSFVDDIDSAYILEYQSLVMARTGDKVSNSVSFTGSNEVLVQQETTKEITVGISSGSGTGSGVRGTLTVTKLDDADHLKKLGGATFELYRLTSTDRVLMSTATTNAEGKATFAKLWLGSYVLIETAAPEGYVLDSKEYPVTVGSATEIMLNVTNRKADHPTATPEPTSTPAPTATPLPTATPAPTATAVPTAEPTVPPGSNETPAPGSTVPPSAPATPGSGFLGAPVSPVPSASTVPGVIIDDPEVPAGPGNVPDVQPSPPSPPAGGGAPDEEIPVDDDVPSGGVDIDEEEVPAGTVITPPAPNTAVSNEGMLPQTGESSPLPLYLAGMGLILLGFVLNRVYKRNHKAE